MCAALSFNVRVGVKFISFYVNEANVFALQSLVNSTCQILIFLVRTGHVY